MGVEEKVRVLFADQLNLARGKYIPRSYAERGQVNFCLGAYAVTYCRQLLNAPGAKMMQGLPDMEAVFDMKDARDSWDYGTKVVIADLQEDGKPLALDGRALLKRTLKEWDALGYTVKVGLETEAYIYQRDADGTWVPYDTPGAYVYGTGPATDPAGLIDEIWENAAKCGFNVESLNSEYDSPQFELTLKYDDALKAVDDMFLFRLMAREVVAKRGYMLNFMPKPIAGSGGSGLHVNFSLWKDGKNMLNDENAERGLSDLGHQAIAGMLHHHEGMAALMAPTVNSYKRLIPENLAGYWANWGYDHRGVTVRVSQERGDAMRLEHRMGDCASSPYIAVATVLQTALLGVQNGYPVPPAETGDCFENVNTDRHTPANLGDALKALKADKALVEKIGETMVANFVHVKEAELEVAKGQPDEWDFEYYSPFI